MRGGASSSSLCIVGCGVFSALLFLVSAEEFRLGSSTIPISSVSPTTAVETLEWFQLASVNFQNSPATPNKSCSLVEFQSLDSKSNHSLCQRFLFIWISLFWTFSKHSAQRFPHGACSRSLELAKPANTDLGHSLLFIFLAPSWTRSDEILLDLLMHPNDAGLSRCISEGYANFSMEQDQIRSKRVGDDRSISTTSIPSLLPKEEAQLGFQFLELSVISGLIRDLSCISFYVRSAVIGFSHAVAAILKLAGDEAASRISAVQRRQRLVFGLGPTLVLGPIFNFLFSKGPYVKMGGLSPVEFRYSTACTLHLCIPVTLHA